MKQNIAIIFSFFCFIPFTLGVVLFKRLNREERLFVGLALYEVIKQVVSYILVMRGINGTFLTHIDALVPLVFLVFILFPVPMRANQEGKLSMAFLISSVVIVNVVEFFADPDPSRTNIWPSVLSSAIIVLLAIGSIVYMAYYSNSDIKRNPLLYISIASAIYYSSSTYFYLNSEYYISKSIELAKTFFMINTITYGVVFMGLSAFGLLKKPKGNGL